MEWLDEVGTVIMDSGSGYVKCGLGGEDEPRAIFPSVVALPEHRSDIFDYIVGSEALEQPDMSLKYPVAHGMITNWNMMVKLWHHAFYDVLKLTPEENKVFLTQGSLGGPRNTQEKMTSIMFETFNICALTLSGNPTLSLFASGRTTGLVLDSGDGVTHSVPVYEGYWLPHATLRLNLGGRDVSETLGKILLETRDHLPSDILRDIKEKHCFVARDFDEEMRKSGSTDHTKVEYSLPDGTEINFGNQRFRAPEIMFRPQLAGPACPGVDEQILNSIQKCDIDIRASLYKNIVLAGGNTMFEGFGDRAQIGLQRIAPPNARVQVQSPENRSMSGWIGASIMTTIAAFNSRWITKEEYDETGSQCVHRLL